MRQVESVETEQLLAFRANRIVVVEDDIDLQKLIERKLGRAGFETLCLSTGGQVLAQAGVGGWDLLLLDYKLPDMTAKEVIDGLSREGVSIPFVIVTGHGDEKVAVEMMKSGARDYVIKDSQFIDALPKIIMRVSRELRVEKALTETEAKLREFRRMLFTLMSHLPGMAYRCLDDKERTMTFVSAGVRDLTGFKGSELTGRDGIAFSQLVNEQDRETMFKAIQHAIAKRRPFEVLYRIHTADKGEKWVWDRGSGIFSEDGRLLGIEGFMNDVTEGKHAEAALRESEEKYRSIVETASEGIVLADASTSKILFANQRMAEIADIPLNELVGRSFFDLANEQQSGVLSAAWQQRSTGVRGQYEVPISRRDGSQGWVMVNAAPVYDHEGRHTASLAMATDVTMRRNVEEALQKAKAELEIRVKERTADLEAANRELAAEISQHKKAQEALKRTDSALRLLLDQMPCILWTTDTQLNITSVLGAGLAGIGFGPNQAVGRPLREFAGNRDSIFPAISAHVKALEGKKVSYEAGVSDRTLHCHVEPLYSISGDAAGVIGAAIDITERKHAEEQLRQISNRIVEVQETERRAIARELHDQVGQSLTALKLSLERTLNMSGKEARQGYKSAISVVNDLMKRVRELSFDLRPSMLDDLGLLPALLWLFEKYQEQTRVKVKFEHKGLAARFPAQISVTAYRIVQEALTNVARHSGVKEATVRAWCDEAALSVMIEDRGIGFDPASVLAGRSVGLGSMQERAFASGGKLSIESVPGGGTCLTAELPLRLDTREGAGQKK